MASGGYDRPRERLTYTNIKEQSGEEIESEFVVVPRDLKGYVIGKGGCMIHEIRQTSGARVSSQSREEEGFTISGNEEQRTCARRLIEQKLKEVRKRKRELVKVEGKYKGLVIGKQGANLQRIYNQTGAKVIHNPDDGEFYVIFGTEEQRKHAKVRIGEIVSIARMRDVENEIKKVSCYIDGLNLQVPKLKLEQDLPAGTHPLYRLKPAKEYGEQEQCSCNNYGNPSYQTQLMKDVFVTLRKIKQEMAVGTKADMWCHFGTTTIRVSDQENVQKGEWSIDEATGKFQSSNSEHYWKLAFKEGVNPNEGILKKHYKERIPEETEYVSRYDLTFLTPSLHYVRCKVWVANKNAGNRLEGIPIPLDDVKNILEEVNFEDKGTRSRCRGWLVLKSRKYLQADILFPGCEFDCRFHIRGRTESAQAIDYAPDEDVRNALLTHLSGLTLTDEDALGLRLPEDIPEGFNLIHKRCSKRTEYTADTGFSIILSKEQSWDIERVEIKESTDVHLHCKEWDTSLSTGVWEPEVIVKKLPEFLKFVKEVQVFLFHDKIPPEILARGPSAMKAYNRALSDGKTVVKRVPIMLIGQDRAGKTSLKKSLKGICFDPEEDSTVGIDVDPSHFKVSTETWRTGTTNQDQNSDKAISFDYHTAICIVDSVKTERKNIEVNPVRKESSGSFDSDVTEIPGDPRLTEPSREHTETSREEPTLRRHEPQISSHPTDQYQEDLTVSTPNVPEEVAAEAESLLRSDLGDNREDIYSTLWDFAGHSVYYVTHPLFLTKRAIYCLVYDLSLNPHDIAKPLVKQGIYKEKQESFNLKTNLDYLDFWMMSVASLASCEDECPRSEVLPEKLPPVFLVCTHADTPYGRRDPRELALEIFGCLKSKPYGAQLHDVFFVDNTSLKVNNSDCPEVARLRQDVLAVARQLPHINEAIPIKWLKFEKTLQAVKERGYKCISLKIAKDIATKICNILEDNVFETLMNYLHDLRRYIHFDDTTELNELVVLDSQWLVDVFKKVITIKPYDPKENKFLQLWCKLEREGILDEKLLAHVWEPLFDNKETSDSLVGIMEKFSLLCPCPSDSSSNKSYLVPSMLKSHPPEEVRELVESAKIPSLFVKFANSQVPPGLFPRLVLQFLQWGKEKFWTPEKPQLFHDFARFFTSQDGYSVILVYHSYSVEVVVHDGNFSDEFADDLASKMNSSEDFQHKTTGVICAHAVHRQLGLMLECMRNDFPWLRNMTYEMSVICPVCCKGKAVDYCQTHHVKGCTQEQCLHFWTVTELCSENKNITCKKSAFAKNTKVAVMKFSPWFPSPKQQLEIGEHDGDPFHSDEGNQEKALAVRNTVYDSLSSKSCDSTQVVCRLKESLQLDQASLEQPDPETKKWIRCLAREAKFSDRLDVVKHLREITPAGTTGPLLSESLDVRRIPFSQARQLTVALTVAGGDKWMFVAEKLGLNSEEIRFLDERNPNPVEALIGFIANHRCLTVGELYKVLCDCGIPVIADKL